MKNAWKGLVPVAVGLIILALPVPEGLKPFAWHYFALFMAVIVGLILEPIPAAAIGLIGVTLGAAFRLVPMRPDAAVSTSDAVRWALSGFSNGTVWLIFTAFIFSLGYEKTGLGKRVSLVLIKALGKSTLGLGYAVALADLIIAPFTPSNTARSGGTIFPIIKNIPPLYDCTPDHEPRRIGGYLMWVALATTCVTSSMFLTGVAPNPLALDILNKTTKITVSWTEWFVYLAPPCVLLFLAIPLLTYIIYPPSVKKSEDAPKWAAAELVKLGPMTRQEMTMAGLALFALALWIFGSKWFDATTAALMAMSLMIITGVVTWQDVTGHKTAWNVLAWFGTLVALADGLNKVGFLAWFAKTAAASMSGFSMTALVIALVALFFLVHYLFASITAHTTALLPVMLATAMGVAGVPMKPLGMLLCGSLGLMGILTPYATGPSPIYYGSGYITPKEYWTLGFIFGMIFLVVYIGLGYPWLMMMAN